MIPLSTHLNTVGSTLFFLAILHTFITPWIKIYATKDTYIAKFWHICSEIELVFGIWAMVFIAYITATKGIDYSTHYLLSLRFVEPLFVLVIMLISATRPISETILRIITWISHTVPLPNGVVFYFTVLVVLPILGSWITEFAAMILATLLLSQPLFKQTDSPYLKYATLAVLFVNISIGGTFTTIAAPAVVMVAQTWQWDTVFMINTFAYKATIAILINTLIVTAIFYKKLCTLKIIPTQKTLTNNMPILLILVHYICLGLVIVFSHQTIALFIMLIVLFIITHLSSQYQTRLMIRESLLVALFLSGLIILGQPQRAWLQVLFNHSNDNQLFLGSILLTAVIDNAALTYLASLIDNLSDLAKYYLVAGALTGGGLTVIANAPNPAGLSILKIYFPNQTVEPFKLLIAAFIPTTIAAIAFYYIK